MFYPAALNYYDIAFENSDKYFSLVIFLIM